MFAVLAEFLNYIHTYIHAYVYKRIQTTTVLLCTFVCYNQGFLSHSPLDASKLYLVLSSWPFGHSSPDPGEGSWGWVPHTSRYVSTRMHPCLVTYNYVYTHNTGFVMPPPPPPHKVLCGYKSPTAYASCDDYNC